MNIHILGICGTLMGSIALLARASGHTVSGSDRNVYPPMSDQLAEAGITLNEGYDPAHLEPAPDLVIMGNAGLPRGNPAVEHVLRERLPFVSGAEWLGRYLLPDRWVIAIAGTHGKTTTTSMVAHILEQAGLEPGYLVGGVPLDFGTSARLGSSPFFVIEADEYDTSYFDRRSKFLHYYPRTLVIGNIEYDHADIFDDVSAIQNQFHLLLRTLPANGQLIHPVTDPLVMEVIERGCWSEQFAIGEGGRLTASQAVTTPQGTTRFDVLLDGDVIGTVTWTLTGQHNVRNALAAIAAARHAGVPPAHAIAALSTFHGVKRRMERIFHDERVTVYDDFAHHPTAITSTLGGLRDAVGPTTPILAVIEPASHTMRGGTHVGTLPATTAAADAAYWFQPPNSGWDLAAELGDAAALVTPDLDNLVTHTVDWIARHPGCQVVIMSNGGFGGLHRILTARLEG